MEIHRIMEYNADTHWIMEIHTGLWRYTHDHGGIHRIMEICTLGYGDTHRIMELHTG